MTESAAAIATFTFIFMGAWVGARLLVLASRTRALPEASLGIALLLIVGVGYALHIFPMALGLDVAVASTAAAVGIACMVVGWSATWVFTWRVFRPESRTALVVSLVAIATLLVSGAIQSVRIASEDQLRLASSDPTWTAIRLCALSVYVWCGVESTRYWSMLKKRVRLGLADPVVANRFLLWAVVMGVSFANVVVPALAALVGAPDESPAMRLWIAVTGFVCTVALYLAFFPPRAYRERIAAAGGGG